MPYRSQTLAIQTAIKGVGYDPGPLDGWFGNKTEAAVNKWLAGEGEPARQTTTGFNGSPPPRPARSVAFCIGGTT